MKINVIGIDPSLRNFGFARGVYDSETGDVEITGIALSETHAATKEDKKNSRQNELDLADAVIHQNTMIHQCVGNEIAFAEVPVGSQSSRAMLSVGVCIGILSSCPIPMIAVTPTQVKKAGTGVGTASKDEMIASAHMLHPDAPWLTIKRKGAMELLGKNEHMADAIFAIYAGIRTAEFKQVLAAMKELRGGGGGNMSEKPVGVQRRLAVAGKFEVRHQIDQYSGMTVGARSKNEMMEEVIKQSARQLEDFACAACMRCKNMEPKVEQYEDPVRMVTQVQMTLTCKPGQSHCPDGFDLEKRAFVSSSPDADLPYGDEWNTEEGFVARVMNHDTLPERVKKWHELQAEQMKAGTMTMTIATGGPVREIVMADEKSGEPVKLHRSGETELLYPEDMSRFIRHLPKDRWAMGGTSKMSTEDFNREYLTTFKNADGTTAPSFKENGNTVYVPVGKPDVPQTLDDSVW